MATDPRRESIGITTITNHFLPVCWIDNLEKSSISPACLDCCQPLRYRLCSRVNTPWWLHQNLDDRTERYGEKMCIWFVRFYSDCPIRQRDLCRCRQRSIASRYKFDDDHSKCPEIEKGITAISDHLPLYVRLLWWIE